MRKKPAQLGRRLQFLSIPKYPMLPHEPEKEQVSVIRTNCHPGI
ncbi:MAG: hypothetical protein N2491_11245 [Negativicutes bacterium]|nr:hypothetical protein [Negativicutes bacterium]